MAAGKALRATVATAGVTPGVGAPTAKRPATAASTPASIQANMETRPRRMPISAAASPSSAAARIEMPQLEYLKVTKNAAISTPATTMASARFVVMPTPPSEIASPPHGWPRLRMSEPMRRVSSVMMMRSTPIVRMARLMTGAPRSRLMSTRSTSSAAMAEPAMPTATAPQKPSVSWKRPMR